MLCTCISNHSSAKDSKSPRKKALGDTTAADPPIARAEEVDQKSDTGHAVMRSGVQIEAEKAAKQERSTDRTAKKNAKVVAEKEAADDVLRESNVFWCCLQDDGNEHCTRSFQKKGWLKKTLLRSRAAGQSVLGASSPHIQSPQLSQHHHHLAVAVVRRSGGAAGLAKLRRK